MGITLSKQGRHEQCPLLGWAPALQTLTPALKNMGHLNPMYIHARDYPKKQARITPMRIFRYRSHLLPRALLVAGSASHLVPSAPPLLSPWVSRQDLPSADTAQSPWLPLLMSPHPTSLLHSLPECPWPHTPELPLSCSSSKDAARESPVR